MVTLAVGLSLHPRVLLLDEPMEGLAPVIDEQLARVIRELRHHARMSMILAEQHARLALELTDEVLVIDRGRVVHRGASSALLAMSSCRSACSPSADSTDSEWYGLH
jgi:branched-chain amino acid transport system ATP-binding protein